MSSIGAATPAFISDWLTTVRPTTFAEIAPDPYQSAIFTTDMINGFVHDGPLASERVHALADPVRAVIVKGWHHGIRDIVLLQDTHHPNTPEFESYPPHCVAGTVESATIPELASLPFADAFVVIEKNSLNPAIGTAFDSWLEANPHLTTAIVVGNCTDLCTYQLAMHLRMRANAFNIARFRVIVVVDAVATFDIPGSADLGPGRAHPGDFFHNVFLYHMSQNGVEIVSGIA